MTIPAVAALSAGVSAADALSGTANSLLGGTTGSAATAQSFGATLSQVATDAIGTLKKGESVAISGMEGKASVQQVVEAVMNAQQTLATAIAVRDKLVSAYQDISRMAI